MKQDILFVAIAKRIGGLLVVLACLMLALAGWQVLEAGPQKVLASREALQTFAGQNLGYMVFLFVFAAPFLIVPIVTEIMKRRNFDLETLNDSYTVPRESLVRRAIKKIVVWLLIAAALSVGMFVLKYMAGGSIETTVSEMWPFLATLLVCAVPLTLMDTLFTAIQRRFEDHKSRQVKRPSHLP